MGGSVAIIANSPELPPCVLDVSLVPDWVLEVAPPLVLREEEVKLVLLLELLEEEVPPRLVLKVLEVVPFRMLDV
jgi:hypothetical protein